MKTFDITVSGKTLSDVMNAIHEAGKRIENGYTSGFDSNDDGEFSFSTEGDYEGDTEGE